MFSCHPPLSDRSLSHSRLVCHRKRSKTQSTGNEDTVRPIKLLKTTGKGGRVCIALLVSLGNVMWSSNRKWGFNEVAPSPAERGNHISKMCEFTQSKNGHNFAMSLIRTFVLTFDPLLGWDSEPQYFLCSTQKILSTVFERFVRF